MSNELFSATPARTKLAFDRENTLYATFTVNPPKVEAESRAPLDLGVALDVSGSMDGMAGVGVTKMQAAKKSCTTLIDHLTDKDRITLVTFTTHVEVIMEPTLMDTVGKKKARECIQRMYSRSATNLSGGLLSTFNALVGASKVENAVKRVLLFTDGCPTAGEMDRTKIVALARKFRQGLPISTFGYGSQGNFDPELLSELALDGNFYHIDTPEKILSAFASELGGLISTYGQNVSLTLKPAEGVEVVEVLNDLTVDEKDGLITVQCDDLLAEQPYDVVVEVKTAKRDKHGPRDIKLVGATLKFVNVVETVQAEEVCALKCRFVQPGKEDTEDDPKVMDEVALQKSIQAQVQAQARADAGDFQGAQSLLLASADFSKGLGTERSLKLSDVHQGLVAESFSDEDAYRARGRAQTMSFRRFLGRKTGGTDQDVGGVNVGAMYANMSQNNTKASFAAHNASDPEPSPDAPEVGVGQVVPPKNSGKVSNAKSEPDKVAALKKKVADEDGDKSVSKSRSRSGKW